MKNKLFFISIISASMALTNSLQASPTVYIPLGSANKVIKVDAATDTITATYTGVDNPHGLVATNTISGQITLISFIRSFFSFSEQIYPSR